MARIKAVTPARIPRAGEALKVLHILPLLSLIEHGIARMSGLGGKCEGLANAARK